MAQSNSHFLVFIRHALLAVCDTVGLSLLSDSPFFFFYLDLRLQSYLTCFPLVLFAGSSSFSDLLILEYSEPHSSFLCPK